MTNDTEDADIDEEASRLIADQIQRYTDLFQAQVERAGGWPEKFSFPEPANDIEREALRLFLAEVETTTGVRVKVTAAG